MRITVPAGVSGGQTLLLSVQRAAETLELTVPSAAAKGDRGDASDPQKPVWKSTTRSRGQRRVDGVGRQKCCFRAGGS